MREHSNENAEKKRLEIETTYTEITQGWNFTLLELLSECREK